MNTLKAGKIDGDNKVQLEILFGLDFIFRDYLRFFFLYLDYLDIVDDIHTVEHYYFGLLPYNFKLIGSIFQILASASG